MAKVKMKYMEIAAPITYAKDLVDFLQMKGVLELRELEETEGLSSLESGKTVASISKYSDTAQTALSILDKYAPEKSGLISKLNPLPEMSRSEYEKKSDEADEILGVCFDIVSNEKTIAESKAEIVRAQAAMDAVEQWIALDVPMQFKGTKTTDAFTGYFPAEYTADSLSIALAPYIDEDAAYDCEIISRTPERTCVFILCDKENSEKVFSAIRTLGFAYPSDPTKHPPAVRYERMKAKIDECKEKIKECRKNIKELACHRDDIKFACDWFAVKRDKYEALSKVYAGGSFIALSGYVPADRADGLCGEIEEKFTAAVTVDDAPDDDDVPVLLENKSVIAAVEPITEMYASPGKNDIDPNPAMAFFYYLLFGIMLSDAGYGLLMVIGCGLAKFKFKVQGRLKKTVDMYFYCGIATVFWGALFGSWFGDIIPRVADQFFGISNIGEVWNSGLGFNLFRENVALWFEPVNNPTKLLLFSFLFGIIHLFVGVGASFYKMWKQNNKVGAVCDCIPIFLLILGIAPIGANIIKAETFSASVTSVSKWIALAGAVLVVLTAGRDSKNIVGKLGLGLYGMYNTASGWLGDVLSYSRLLALGLCTGVIATVVNTIGTIPEKPVPKLLMLIPVFIFGHVVNMAINLIGTYVHTNRLQYVEFFAKFYEGGGRNFTPLKTNTKYYNIKED